MDNIENTNNSGRPSVITDNCIAKLIEAFNLGCNDEMACDYAEIDPSTFYRHMGSDNGFARKIRSAKHLIRLKAASVITRAIGTGDVALCRWWLEKKYADEFGTRPGMINKSRINISNNYSDKMAILKEKYTIKTSE